MINLSAEVDFTQTFLLLSHFVRDTKLDLQDEPSTLI